MKELEIKYVDIDSVKPYEKNPRKNDDAVPMVEESIRQYGFRVPIVIDKNNVIVAGHTRYRAARNLGMKSVPCVIADDLSDEQIKAYRIADNKVSDFSLWDNSLLLEELESLSPDLFTGFDESELFDQTASEAEIMDESGNRAAYTEAGLKRGETMRKIHGDVYKCGLKGTTASTVPTHGVFFRHQLKPIKVGTILYDKQAIVDRFQQLLAKYKKVRPDKIIEKKTPKRKG